jgi:hypothetical protein
MKLRFAAISLICKYGHDLHLSSGCDVIVLPGVFAGHLRSPTAQQAIAQIVCSHQNYKYVCQSSNRDTSALSVAPPQMSARFGPAMTQVAQRNTVHVGFVPNTVARGGCVVSSASIIAPLLQTVSPANCLCAWQQTAWFWLLAGRAAVCK